VNEEKVIQAKERIEYLRKIHGLRKQDIYNAMGFSRQNYNQKYKESPTLSVKSLIGITTYLGITEYDLLHSSDEEFDKLPIVKAHIEFSIAWETYTKMKIGSREYGPFIKK
jgi:transcriptional regulator with XRE-family HTH domain